MIDKKVMQSLREHISKKIRVEEIWFGRLQISEGVLKKVIDFRSIFISRSGTTVNKELQNVFLIPIINKPSISKLFKV